MHEHYKKVAPQGNEPRMRGPEVCPDEGRVQWRERAPRQLQPARPFIQLALVAHTKNSLQILD